MELKEVLSTVHHLIEAKEKTDYTGPDSATHRRGAWHLPRMPTRHECTAGNEGVAEFADHVGRRRIIESGA